MEAFDDGDGNVWAGGQVLGAAMGPIVSRLSPGGQVEVQTVLGYTSPIGPPMINAMATNPFGVQVYVLDPIGAPASANIRIIGISSTGDVMWDNASGISDTSIEAATALAMDAVSKADGSLIVAGTYDTSTWLKIYDSTGLPQTEVEYSGFQVTALGFPTQAVTDSLVTAGGDRVAVGSVIDVTIPIVGGQMLRVGGFGHAASGRAGRCVGVDPATCNDADPCTVDSCDPDTGECVHDTVVGCP
ncbi:MAG: hypothetical protein ACI9WU_000312 [Myxococcota bacterium]